MLSQKETPITNDSKPKSPTEVKSEPTTPEKKEPVKIETFVDRAKTRFVEAENHLKEKNYIFAICHYINSITNAKHAVENKLNSDSDMFHLIDQSTRALLAIATEQNDLFDKCQPDAKIKLALTLSILRKDDAFKNNIAILNEPGEKVAPLLAILEDKPLLLKMMDNQDIANLYHQSLTLTLKYMSDHKKSTDNQTVLDDKKSLPNLSLQPASSKNDSYLYSSLKGHSIFNSPYKIGLASSIPGAAIYSMANAGLTVVLWGGFYGMIAGGIACYAGNKLAEYCKTKRPGH